MICGLFLIPLFITAVLCLSGLHDTNFSGLLSNHYPWLSIFSLFILGWIFWCILPFLRQAEIHLHHARTLYCFFALSSVLALFVPYREGNSLLCNIHLASAWIGLILFCLILNALLDQRVLRRAAAAVLFTCFLLVLKDGDITGTAELLFGDASSIILTIRCVWQKEKGKHGFPLS